MPVQIMPHMYRMLADEIQWALDEVRLVLSLVPGGLLTTMLNSALA